MKKTAAALIASIALVGSAGATDDDEAFRIPASVGRLIVACTPNPIANTPGAECYALIALGIQAGGGMARLHTLDGMEGLTSAQRERLSHFDVRRGCAERADYATIARVALKRIKRMGYDDSEIALTALYRAFQEGPICGGTKE